MDHCFYHDKQYSQRGWYITNLLLCDTPQNKAPRTGPRSIWHTVPFLWPQEQHRWQSSWVDFTGHRLQLLLLRMVAVVPLLLLPQNSLLTSLAFAPDSEAMSATRLSLMASSSSFIFSGHCLTSIIFCLVYTTTYDSAQFQNRNTSQIWASSTVTAKQI